MEQTGANCSVCMETLLPPPAGTVVPEDPVVSLPCGHAFHEVSATGRSRLCPWSLTQLALRSAPCYVCSRASGPGSRPTPTARPAGSTLTRCRRPSDRTGKRPAARRRLRRPYLPRRALSLEPQAPTPRAAATPTQGQSRGQARRRRPSLRGPRRPRRSLSHGGTSCRPAGRRFLSVSSISSERTTSAARSRSARTPIRTCLRLSGGLLPSSSPLSPARLAS
jgi:hypothetical protein